jgi:hypothetical protein
MQQPVSRQRRVKHASITIELLFETAFSTRSVQRGYKKDNWSDQRLKLDGSQAHDRSSD